MNAVVNRSEDPFDGNIIQYFTKTLQSTQKQISLDKFFIKESKSAAVILVIGILNLQLVDLKQVRPSNIIALPPYLFPYFHYVPFAHNRSKVLKLLLF